MLPKIIRVVVMVDFQGRVFPLTAAQYRAMGADYQSRGWSPLYWLRIPLRRLNRGWFGLYQFSVCRAVHLYGI